MHLMKVSATPDYFQLGLRATFTTEGMDNIPFDPFPMDFPQFYNGSNKRMLDLLISDYTINSLLYNMHKLLLDLIIIEIYIFTLKYKRISFFFVFFYYLNLLKMLIKSISDGKYKYISEN